jgi:CBS domain-containing protein
MADGKSVKDLLIDIFEYPHMPYWFTIRQAAGIMKKTVTDVQKCIHPHVILVFDERYNLIGTLTIRDILKGLFPGLAARPLGSDANAAPSEEDALAQVEASLSGTDVKTLMEKPISEIMRPVAESVSLEDSAAKAAFIMERRNIQVLAVIGADKKLVGVVRMKELFHELSSRIFEKRP